MKKEPEKCDLRTKVEKRVKELGIEAEDLDEMVHDAKSLEASDINNGGLSEQLDYLIEQYGEEQVICMLEGVRE